MTAPLLASLAMTVVLMAFHAMTGRWHARVSIPEAVVNSLAAGVSAAYVFLHLLPELAEGNSEVSEVLGDDVAASFGGDLALLDLTIFFVALIGFVSLYGLERLARVTSGRSGGEAPGGVYRLRLASFAVYNGLITYTMTLRWETGPAFAVLFTLAMGLHFALTDRSLREHNPRRFDRSGRRVLIAALFTGWLLSWLAAPVSTVVVSVLTALLGGFILFTVFHEEIPAERRSRYGWFVVGVGGYAVMLGALTVIGG